jgi:hypothetical protein
MEVTTGIPGITGKEKMEVQSRDPMHQSSDNQKPFDAHSDNKNQLRKTQEKQLHTRHQTATATSEGTISDRSAINTTRQWPSATN